MSFNDTHTECFLYRLRPIFLIKDRFQIEALKAFIQSMNMSPSRAWTELKKMPQFATSEAAREYLQQVGLYLQDNKYWFYLREALEASVPVHENAVHEQYNYNLDLKTLQALRDLIATHRKQFYSASQTEVLMHPYIQGLIAEGIISFEDIFKIHSANQIKFITDKLTLQALRDRNITFDDIVNCDDESHVEMLKNPKIRELIGAGVVRFSQLNDVAYFASVRDTIALFQYKKIREGLEQGLVSLADLNAITGGSHSHPSPLDSLLQDDTTSIEQIMQMIAYCGNAEAYSSFKIYDWQKHILENPIVRELLAKKEVSFYDIMEYMRDYGAMIKYENGLIAQELNRDPDKEMILAILKLPSIDSENLGLIVDKMQEVENDDQDVILAIGCHRNCNSEMLEKALTLLPKGHASTQAVLLGLAQYHDFHTSSDKWRFKVILQKMRNDGNNYQDVILTIIDSGSCELDTLVGILAQVKGDVIMHDILLGIVKQDSYRSDNKNTPLARFKIVLAAMIENNNVDLDVILAIADHSACDVNALETILPYIKDNEVIKDLFLALAKVAHQSRDMLNFIFDKATKDGEIDLDIIKAIILNKSCDLDVVSKFLDKMPPGPEVCDILLSLVAENSSYSFQRNRDVARIAINKMKSDKIIDPDVVLALVRNYGCWSFNEDIIMSTIASIEDDRHVHDVFLSVVNKEIVDNRPGVVKFVLNKIITEHKDYPDVILAIVGNNKCGSEALNTIVEQINTNRIIVNNGIILAILLNQNYSPETLTDLVVKIDFDNIDTKLVQAILDHDVFDVEAMSLLLGGIHDDAILCNAVSIILDKFGEERDTVGLVIDAMNKDEFYPKTALVILRNYEENNDLDLSWFNGVCRQAIAADEINVELLLAIADQENINSQTFESVLITLKTQNKFAYRGEFATALFGIMGNPKFTTIDTEVLSIMKQEYSSRSVQEYIESIKNNKALLEKKLPTFVQSLLKYLDKEKLEPSKSVGSLFMLGIFSSMKQLKISDDMKADIIILCKKNPALKEYISKHEDEIIELLVVKIMAKKTPADIQANRKITSLAKLTTDKEKRVEALGNKILDMLKILSGAMEGGHLDAKRFPVLKPQKRREIPFAPVKKTAIVPVAHGIPKEISLNPLASITEPLGSLTKEDFEDWIGRFKENEIAVLIVKDPGDFGDIGLGGSFTMKIEKKNTPQGMENVISYVNEKGSSMPDILKQIIAERLGGQCTVRCHIKGTNPHWEEERIAVLHKGLK